MKLSSFTCCKCAKEIEGADSVTLTRYVLGEPVDRTYAISGEDLTAVQKKLYGRQIKQFMCFACLLKDLDTEPEALYEMIDSFRAGGCALFS